MSNTFSKNSKQISFFGELATTIATTNTLKEGNKHPSKFFQDISNLTFVDTNAEALDYIQTNRKDAVTLELSKDGTGGRHTVGKELVTDQVWSTAKTKFKSQTQILFGCVGGGTFGSLCEVAHRLQAEGKKVIIFCFDLWESDSQEGNRLNNRNEAVKALSHFTHCFINLDKQSLLGACESVKTCLDNFQMVLNCRSVDSNDLTNILAGNKQFCLINKASLANSVGQKMALASTLQGVKHFANRAGSQKIKNYIAIVGSPTGELSQATQTKVELNYLMAADTASHSKAVPVMTAETATYTIIATLL
jgi:hypothetical protein